MPSRRRTKPSPSQSAILSAPTRSAQFLVLRCTDPADARAVVSACATLPKIVKRLGAAIPAAKLDAAVGFGADFWARISESPRIGKRPEALRPFTVIDAGARSAPATGGDVFVHIKSQQPDLNLDAARTLLEILGRAVTVREDVQGFVYRDSRDLTGFIDGTQNPKGKARTEAALIGAEDAAFAGGSYALTQRYVHDLERWGALPLREQEAAIGRRKRDSKELSKAPPSAHIRRAELREGDLELPILRQSSPYGRPGGELGLYFLAYSRDPGRFERMLKRMLGVAGDGQHDRLMEFTRAVSGAFFFMPSATLLKKLA